MGQKNQINEQVVDLFVAYKFIKILTTDFDKTDAFKLGIIDKNGKILKKRKDLRGEERAAYTVFHTLIWNLKKLMLKVPGIKSKIGSYATALYLLKELYNKEYNNREDLLLEGIMNHLNIHENDMNVLFENNFNRVLSCGVYVAAHEIISPSFNNINEGDIILVGINKQPTNEFKNVPLYTAVHMESGEEIIVGNSSIEKIHENIETAPEMVAGMAVFDVKSVPHTMMTGHDHHERWGKEKFNSIDDDLKSTIRKYSYRNKDKTIALREPHGAITPFKKGRDK